MEVEAKTASQIFIVFLLFNGNKIL